MNDARLARLRAIRAIVRPPSDTARPGVRSDINVTPLVDVVLVLLIIFMVVTPLIASGVAVDLPRTRNHDSVARRRQATGRLHHHRQTVLSRHHPRSTTCMKWRAG